MEGDKLVFRGLVASPDGSQFYDTTREGKPEDAVAMGHDAGMELKVRIQKNVNTHKRCAIVAFAV